MLPIKVLQKSNSENVLRTLERCYNYILPFLNEKNLTIYISEFFPKNPNLLGMNKGLKSKTIYSNNTATIKPAYDIYIRVRYARSENKFISDHDLIGTLLHEVVHCYIGPHNAEFYTMLDEFWIQVQMINPKYKKSSVGYKLGGKNKPLNSNTLANAASERLIKKDNKTCGTVHIDLTTTSTSTVIDLTHL